jgi:hypothetical protein
MLWGGRGEAAAPASAQTTSSGGTCEFQAKGQSYDPISGISLTGITEFTKCLDAADVQTCTWFLDQLKAVSSIASMQSIPDLFLLVPGGSVAVLGSRFPFRRC